MLVIGHQFSSLAKFDRIFALEDGQLRELTAQDKMSLARVVKSPMDTHAV